VFNKERGGEDFAMLRRIWAPISQFVDLYYPPFLTMLSLSAPANSDAYAPQKPQNPVVHN
jgi:hypothetical protein